MYTDVGRGGSGNSDRGRASREPLLFVGLKTGGHAALCSMTDAGHSMRSQQMDHSTPSAGALLTAQVLL